MAKHKKEKVKTVEEPAVAYGEKRIVFFNSFEEAKEKQRMEMASKSYEERLINLEILRQRSKHFSYAAENEKPTNKIITIIKAHYL